MYLYLIVFNGTDAMYVGITRDLQLRKNSHYCCANTGVKTPLYDCIRKYETFTMCIVDEFDTWDAACLAEIDFIKEARENGWNLLNLADGGEGGFVVPEDKIESWKKKLSDKRKGRTPAAGMKHTKENKALFSRVSREYWNSQDTYDAEEVTSVPFKEAKVLFGISKTHYYRLKRSLSND